MITVNKNKMIILCWAMLIIGSIIGYFTPLKLMKNKTTYNTNDLSIVKTLDGNDSDCYILTDEVTGIQYIVTHISSGVAMSPRYDSDGYLYFPYMFEGENQ